MVKWWPWQRVRERSVALSDYPAILGVFGVNPSDAGVPVTESSVLGVSSVYRAVSLISGTIGTLPLPTFRQIDDGTRQQVVSFLDERPAGPTIDMTPYEWKETLVGHLLLWGNAYLMHVYNAAGGLVGAVPFHPSCVAPEWERVGGIATGRKLFQVSDVDGRTAVLNPDQMTHVPGLSFDGLKGYSVLTVARNSLGKSIAADRAAARSYGNGLMVGGVAVPEEDLTEEDDPEKVSADLTAQIGGWENAGRIPVLTRKLRLEKWSMSHADAQFLESRQFEVEEVARWFGLLPIHLAQTEKQTSWGSGVAEQHRGLGKFTLNTWTTRIQQRASRMLSRPRYVEFQFDELNRPAPEVEIPLLISQVQAGLLTPNEARRKLGRDPLPEGDQLQVQPATGPNRPVEPEEVPA